MAAIVAWMIAIVVLLVAGTLLHLPRLRL